MSGKRIFEVGYMEYPNTTLVYKSIKVDISNYPELEGKTDDEVIDYIRENAYQMKPTNEFNDSLGEELLLNHHLLRQMPQPKSRNQHERFFFLLYLVLYEDDDNYHKN